MFNVPSHNELQKIVELIRSIIFPDFFPATTQPEPLLKALMLIQLSTVIEDTEEAKRITKEFCNKMPEIRALVEMDVDAAIHNDPAVASRAEVIYCYPLIREMLHYRPAHCLYQLGVPLIPRMLTEMAHSETGIDIHPAAQIGDHFCIDHGTGVVIGETAIIGSHVVLYQGVTLGAKNFQYDEQGKPMNVPRHPIIEDNVTIYSNASVLGRIRIGHDTIVGGNIWLTHDVPPHSRVVQRPCDGIPPLNNVDILNDK